VQSKELIMLNEDMKSLHFMHVYSFQEVLHFLSVLILTGIELIFFIAAGMEPYFGFATTTVLITQEWFSCC